VLKRLATAGMLTVAAGGVLLTAAPAMAGGHGDYYKSVKNDNDTGVAIDYDIEKEHSETKSRNKTIGLLNIECAQIQDINVIQLVDVEIPIAKSKNQYCIHRNVDSE